MALSFEDRYFLRRGYRKPYEFTSEIKKEALRRADYKCERCGVSGRDTAEGYLQIHHRIAIGWYVSHKRREFSFLAPEVIKSIINTEVLCCTCHDQLHDEETLEEYVALARVLQEEFALSFLNHLADQKTA